VVAKKLFNLLTVIGLRYVIPIDLVLIDQQRVGKRRLHLMDTVNAKKRWTTIYWQVNKFLKESHVVFAKERVSLLRMNDINGNANSMVIPIFNYIPIFYFIGRLCSLMPVHCCCPPSEAEWSFLDHSPA
jgi:hypothetical protein